METKFTKGEWSVKYSNGDAAVYYPHGFFTSANVIKVDDTRLDGESWLAMRDRTEVDRENATTESNANMNLIAAAPSMYDFIKSLLDVESLSMDHDEIIALLKKARGES